MRLCIARISYNFNARSVVHPVALTASTVRLCPVCMKLVNTKVLPCGRTFLSDMFMMASQWLKSESKVIQISDPS